MRLYIYDIELNLVTVIDDVKRFEDGVLSDYYLRSGYIISTSKFTDI